MIHRALKLVGLDVNDQHVKMHDSPALSGKLLDNDPNGKLRLQPWHYCSAVDFLSYISTIIHPDITMLVKQCARLYKYPRQEHEEAVKRILRYLLRVHGKGLIIKPDRTCGLECWVDADWADTWKHCSYHDPLSAHSCMGFIIMHDGCTILWKISMQKLVALSTTEVEYIALYSELREVISIINLLEELKVQVFGIHTGTPNVKCKTCEDNKICIEIATNHKTHPRKKHL